MRSLKELTLLYLVTLIILPIFKCQSPSPAKSRSINNFVATSVPYAVEEGHLQNHHAVDQSQEDMTLIASSSPHVLEAVYVHQDPQPSASITTTHQEVNECPNEDQCVINGTSNSNTIIKDHHLTAEGTFKPYSQEELNKILEKYEGEKDHLEAQETTNNKVATFYNVINSNPTSTANHVETSSQSNNDPDKSKAWNLVSYHQHQQPVYSNSQPNNHNNNNNKNPYNDPMGWVTLEPIAWSSSQVQKWEPNSKPGWPLPSNNDPWGPNSPDQYQQQSNYGGYSERPYKKPSYQYQPKPWNSKPPFNENYGNQDIITDGQLGYFPQDRPSPDSPPFSNQPPQGNYKPWLESTQSISYVDTGNRPQTHVVYQGVGSSAGPTSHIPERPHGPSGMGDGDGHWVLLSSTKGYSNPHRQRSSSSRAIDIDKQEPSPKTEEKRERPISARRSIKLTVLPPGDGKTITSHNGMIEMEASGKTVDESHREHLARMMKFGNISENEIHTVKSNSFHNVPAKVEAVVRPGSQISPSAERRNSLISATGGGIIPATMAMILPMLLGRRKRSLEPKILTVNIRNYESQPRAFEQKQNKYSQQRKFMYY